jgi:RimJ/RimL family protein N-acetyltransferase
MEQLAARGITFATLAQEQEQQTDWLERFCDLDNETRRGNVGTPRTVEQMRERLVFLEADPELLFLAKAGELYVGYTLLNAPHPDEDASVLRQGWTGVRPEFRRQGIATALKILGIAYAHKHGYRAIVTEPRTANVASVAMSKKVGFRERPERG